MGGFAALPQAVTAGIGEAGEQAGQGFNQALNESLRVRAQTLAETQSQQHIDYLYKSLAQQATLEGQRNDLLRQQILQQGMRDMGVTKDSNGNYIRTFLNPDTKQQTTYPVNGIPPDSPEAHLALYKQLQEQGFDSTRAAEIAFKVNSLYRSDPAGLTAEYTKYAGELADKGINSIPVPGFGTIDLTTPEGQARYGQVMTDSYFGKGQLLRSLMGYGPGTAANKDMTGFTPGELREYKAFEDPLNAQMAAFEKFAVANLGNTLDPEQRDSMMKSYLQRIGDMEKQKSAKFDEIQGRRAWSTKAFKQANPTATPAQIALAQRQAKAAGKNIID